MLVPEKEKKGRLEQALMCRTWGDSFSSISLAWCYKTACLQTTATTLITLSAIFKFTLQSYCPLATFQRQIIEE